MVIMDTSLTNKILLFNKNTFYGIITIISIENIYVNDRLYLDIL